MIFHGYGQMYLKRYHSVSIVCLDHECSVDHNVVNDHSKMILELAMPHPLPKYDDKERFGHDVVNLLLNKFPSMLQYSDIRKNILQKFDSWMRATAKNGAANRLEWPSVKDESYVQSCVWYLMALHHYRQSNHDEIEIYSKLFLTSGYATSESRVAAGAWAVLAYSCVFRLFQMDDDLLYLEWPWYIIPFRVSILMDNTVGVVFFQLANTLYQIATRLSRFFLTVPSDDWRLRHSESILTNLRCESQFLFEEALSQAFHCEGGICEYQWLCYFFLAKLQAKLAGNEVVKIVDGFYEAACSCELSEFFYPIKISVKKQQNIEPVEIHYQIHATIVDGFYEAACSCELSEFFYPIKISVKKQQNIEPVEIHYQIHATVWKYLQREQSPPLETLVSLLAYLRAIQNHKVIRSNLSLFSSHPDIHESVIYVTINCSDVVKDDVVACVDNILTRVDFVEELWYLCHRGFELTCERFPHMKSYYRLAEMELSRGNVEAAYGNLTKHVFRRKKRDDSLFDSVVEITSQDIDRSGSFPYHVERALQLTMSLAYILKDISTIVSIISTLVVNVERNSEEFILKERQGALLMHAVSRLHILVMESSSPRHVRYDIYRAWQAVSKCKSLAVRNIQVRLQVLIQKTFGAIENFVAEQSVIDDHKKRHVRKRKITSFDLGTSHPCIEHLSCDEISSRYHDITKTKSHALKVMRATVMDCIVAASTGALKGINLRENSFTNLLPIKTLCPKQHEITSLIWSSETQSDVLAALLDRQLKLYDSHSNSFNPLFNITGGEGAVWGLHTINGDKIVSCVESGHISVWSEPGECCGKWETGSGLNTRNEVLTGGLRHLIKTWDIETGRCLWSAKNVPPNFLGLEVPITCTDARYVNQSGVIIEATKLHELRMYDPRAQRRPVKLIPFMDVPLTAVSKCYRANHIIAANSVGEMGLFDLRSKVHPVCKYKGQAGAIRSIDAHPTAPYVATCGIDRFLRVHDIDTRKLAHKIYCKTRLNRVLIRSELSSLATVIDDKTDQEWTELKKETTWYDDSPSVSSANDDRSADECESTPMSGYNKVNSKENDDGEPEAKRKRMSQTKKRKDRTLFDDEHCEIRKKMKIEKGVKRKEVKEQVDSDEEPSKRKKVNKRRRRKGPP
ncbi:WD domain, G-beta repeat protein [Dictyocaulus viviparus]|uniref:WD domain, G-beta repeat protein n=1 Tax=Dictyocaulus viviparus TaxID=29172 RepID=A0A0D8XQG4_DICVI|nr:WD domain, G-beta repeat protein [Dictyocaulus viviparus]